MRTSKGKIRSDAKWYVISEEVNGWCEKTVTSLITSLNWSGKCRIWVKIDWVSKDYGMTEQMIQYGYEVNSD